MIFFTIDMSKSVIFFHIILYQAVYMYGIQYIIYKQTNKYLYITIGSIIYFHKSMLLLLLLLTIKED